MSKYDDRREQLEFLRAWKEQRVEEAAARLLDEKRGHYEMQARIADHENTDQSVDQEVHTLAAEHMAHIIAERQANGLQDHRGVADEALDLARAEIAERDQGLGQEPAAAEIEPEARLADPNIEAGQETQPGNLSEDYASTLAGQWTAAAHEVFDRRGDNAGALGQEPPSSGSPEGMERDDSGEIQFYEDLHPSNDQTPLDPQAEPGRDYSNEIAFYEDIHPAEGPERDDAGNARSYADLKLENAEGTERGDYSNEIAFYEDLHPEQEGPDIDI